MENRNREERAAVSYEKHEILLISSGRRRQFRSTFPLFLQLSSRRFAVKNYVRESFLTASGCKDIVWVTTERKGQKDARNKNINALKARLEAEEKLEVVTAKKRGEQKAERKRRNCYN